MCSCISVAFSTAYSAPPCAAANAVFYRSLKLAASIISLLSAIVTIYTILCFINIVMSWIPGLKFTAFGRFISAATNPYMNFFSKWGLLRIGSIDFSPIISIGILSLISSILAGIQGTGRIYIGGILATIIYMLWNIISSLVGIFFLLVLIRWIVLLINKGQTSYDSGWNQIDMILNKFSYKIAGTFLKNSFNYQKSLLVTWIFFLVVIFAGRLLTAILVNLCYQLPF